MYENVETSACAIGSVEAVALDGKRAAHTAIPLEASASAVIYRIDDPERAGRVLVIHGKVNGRDCRFMIDTGATADFMSAEYAARVGLKVSEGNFGYATEAFGASTQISRRIEGAEVTLGAATRAVHFLIVPLDAYDAILGASYLER